MPNLKDYTKKERVANCWLMGENEDISAIAEAANCSYEYARRLIRDIESGEIDPAQYSDQDLQSILSRSSPSKSENATLGEVIMGGDTEEIKEEDSVSINDTISEEESEFETSENGENFVSKADLKEVSQRIEELQAEGEYHLNQGKRWAVGKYYVSSRSLEYVDLIIDKYDDEIPHDAIKMATNRINELYEEAKFEAEMEIQGAEQKQYAANRILSLFDKLVSE